MRPESAVAVTSSASTPFALRRVQPRFAGGSHPVSHGGQHFEARGLDDADRRLITLAAVIALGVASRDGRQRVSDTGDGAHGTGTANQIGFCSTAAFEFDAGDADSDTGNAATGTFHVTCESPAYEYRGTVDCLHVYASSTTRGTSGSPSSAGRSRCPTPPISQYVVGDTVSFTTIDDLGTGFGDPFGQAIGQHGLLRFRNLLPTAHLRRHRGLSPRCRLRPTDSADNCPSTANEDQRDSDPRRARRRVRQHPQRRRRSSDVDRSTTATTVPRTSTPARSTATTTATVTPRDDRDRERPTPSTTCPSSSNSARPTPTTMAPATRADPTPTGDSDSDGRRQRPRQLLRRRQPRTGRHRPRRQGRRM